MPVELPAVFPLLENADPDGLAETMDELMSILSQEAPEQFEVFGRWVTNYLAGTTAAGVAGPIHSAGEIKTVFATKLKEYGERLKKEAREEGRQEGRQEGLRQGLRQAARKTAVALKD